MRACGTLTGSTSSEGRVSGYVFKVLRESIRRTQEQLAADLSVSIAAIQSWESGRRPMMAMPAGQFLALRSRLGRLGASSTLLAALTLALEADHILAHALTTPHEHAGPGGHPLRSWVLSRPLTTMIAWPIGGKAPNILGVNPPVARRGPVPPSSPHRRRTPPRHRPSPGRRRARQPHRPRRAPAAPSGVLPDRIRPRTRHRPLARRHAPR
jgi:hypothetical protein